MSGHKAHLCCTFGFCASSTSDVLNVLHAAWASMHQLLRGVAQPWKCWTQKHPMHSTCIRVLGLDSPSRRRGPPFAGSGSSRSFGGLSSSWVTFPDCICLGIQAELHVTGGTSQHTKLEIFRNYEDTGGEKHKTLSSAPGKNH